MNELIARARGGDRAAQQDLFLRHGEPLYRYAVHLTGSRADAEDLVQETLIRALSGIAGFRGECGFEGWLFRIALNVHLNARRARRRPEPMLGEPASPAGDPAGAREERALERLREAIGRLPARQQEVILLHTYGEIDSQEIARMLGCSYEAVRMNLSHARRRLREWLADELEEKP